SLVTVHWVLFTGLSASREHQEACHAGRDEQQHHARRSQQRPDQERAAARTAAPSGAWAAGLAGGLRAKLKVGGAGRGESQVPVRTGGGLVTIGNDGIDAIAAAGQIFETVGLAGAVG